MELPLFFFRFLFNKDDISIKCKRTIIQFQYKFDINGLKRLIKRSTLTMTRLFRMKNELVKIIHCKEI